MRFKSFKNCQFTPPTADMPGIVYLFSDEPTDKAEDSFVIVPYKNPETGPQKPIFYALTGAIRHDISPLMRFTDFESPIQLKSRTSKEEYIKKVKKLKSHIQKGDIYEINYCIEFYSDKAHIDPLNVFLKLHAISRAPYSTLLKLDQDYIICASPELFLKKEGSRLITKPIKGTIRRGKNKAEDEALKKSLAEDIKERTENVMAVDVARNDLSMLAKKGTVKVNKLYNIETFDTVHQMVSTVSCELKGDPTIGEILDATFPMASMTGAPKTRAMQLIDATEDFKRNYYSGAMGTIDEKGDFTLSVIIRSIFYNEATKKLSVAVGGAITYLSDPEKEYEECLLKANALLTALNAKIV